MLGVLARNSGAGEPGRRAVQADRLPTPRRINLSPVLSESAATPPSSVRTPTTTAATSPVSAYLFDVTTGQQRFKLFASDAARNADFGFSVAIDGDKAIVSGNGSRAAYVFDVVTGQELFKMIPSESYGIFGYSVGISGNTAIVGAPIESIASSAYLFDVLTGQELFKLTPSDLYVHFGTLFGITVAISGNTAIVGAPSMTKPGATRARPIYLTRPRVSNFSS